MALLESVHLLQGYHLGTSYGILPSTASLLGIREDSWATVEQSKFGQLALYGHCFGCFPFTRSFIYNSMYKVQGLQMVRALLTGEFGQRGGTFWDVTVLRFHTTCDSEVRLGYSQISGSWCDTIIWCSVDHTRSVQAEGCLRGVCPAFVRWAQSELKCGCLDRCWWWKMASKKCWRWSLG